MKKRTFGQKPWRRTLAILCSACMITSCLPFATASAKTVDGLADLSRQTAAEGAVLLKNEDQTLPVKPYETVSVFGRIQINYFKSGTGSGGKVNVDHVTNILDGFRKNPKIHVNEDLAKVYEDWVAENPPVGIGDWTEPWSQAEMPVTEELVADAASKSDKAIIVLGRTAGESKDASNTEGSFLLTDDERDMIQKVTNQFDHVAVLLNVGNIIDMSWVEEYGVESVMYVWHGGMEGGKAVADVVSGDVPASGKLSDTIATSYEDYPSAGNFGNNEYNNYVEDIYVGYRYFETFAPDKVLYPFGFGLTYTDFTVKTTSVEEVDGKIEITVNVTNTGDYKGKQVVQVYYGAPQGELGKAAKSLAGFAKTGLLQPGDSQEMTISYDIDHMASYDDAGKTGHKSAYVLEAGDYPVYVGTSVRDCGVVYTHTEPELRVVEQLQEVMAVDPNHAFERMAATEDAEGNIVMEMEPVPTRTVDVNERIQANLPETIEPTGDQGYTLLDVYNGDISMEEFVAQLPLEDVAYLCRGEGMNSPKVTPGTASAFGGLTDSLKAFGIPIGCCADGPSGIRMDDGELATALPIGTLMACTWNTDLVEKLHTLHGQELVLNNVECMLGPGINIHRDPLCGRNFEYFSEDPVLTGVMASAATRGVQKSGAMVTPKHFAANNQEQNRNNNDSRVSERALREIYLKGFEIVVRDGNTGTIMTSYNKINGIWAASNYDLCTTTLRNEWGFDGMVMTDWWANENEDGLLRQEAAMVRAQNDIAMPVAYEADSIVNAVNAGVLTLGEVQRSAINVLNCLIKSPAFARMYDLDYVSPYEPGEHWFSVEKSEPGDPMISSLTVGGRAIRIFNPLVLDYEVYTKLNEGVEIPEVAVEAPDGVKVQVVQATQENPIAVIYANEGMEERIYKVIFTDEAGLPPVFENPTYAYADDIQVNGESILEFESTLTDYSVLLEDMASIPEITADVPEGVTYTVDYDPNTHIAVIRCESPDQAFVYTVRFSQGPRSDEFDGTELQSFWTVNRPNPENLKLEDGALCITTEVGDLYQTNDNLCNYVTQPAAGNWDAYTKVTFDQKPHRLYQEIGMIVMQDEDNYITFRMEYNESSSAQRPGANFFLSQESNGTHSQLVASKDLADLVTDNVMYLKLSKRGNTYTGAISVDGETYYDLGASASGNYSDPKIGLLASDGSVDGDHLTAKFDYIRFDTSMESEYIPVGSGTTRIKAADQYASISGTMRPENTSDEDGGRNLGYCDKGEYAIYNIEIQKSGYYDIAARISSGQDALGQYTFVMQIKGETFASFTTGGTGGWQNWVTKEGPRVYLEAGKYKVKVLMTTGGLNLNWFEFTAVDTPAEPGDLIVTYPTSAQLAVDGEDMTIANLIGRYETAMEKDASYTLTFTPRVEGEEFAAISVNGEPVVFDADTDTTTYIYEGTMGSGDTALDFSFTVVNKQILRTTIEIAEGRADEAAEAVESVREKYEAALQAAKDVEAKKTATQDEINTAWSDLIDALHYLSFVAGDKSQLEIPMEIAETINRDLFTPDSLKALDEAYAAAEDLLDDEEVLEADITAAVDALYDAIYGLVYRADVTELEALVTKGDSIVANADQYIQNDAWTSFETVLAEAKTVLEDANATQDAVDTAAEDLAAAISALRMIPDKDALEALIGEAEAINTNKYTAKSVATMKAALSTAKAVLNDAEATEEEVADAVETLENSIDGLVEKSTSTGSKNSGSTSANVGNAYGAAGVVSASQSVAANAYVVSDTTVNFTLKRGSAYCFKMTVVNGNAMTPGFTVGNGDVLKTQFVAKVGNDYYYRVYATGTPGQSTGVYTTLPGQNATKHCTVTIG